MEAANEAFGTLSAQHARSTSRARALRAAGAAAVVVACALFVLVWVDGVRMGSGGRHARAERARLHAASACDASLGRRRLWVGPLARGRALCVTHAHAGAPSASDLSGSLVRRTGEGKEVEGDTEAASNLSFLVVGDWGRDGLCCQRDVAIEIARISAATQPAFIASTGNNFYPAGIASSRDAQVDRSWRDIYLAPFPALQRPWRIVLGNHDYLGRAAAQAVLSRHDPHWHLPAPYHFQTFPNGNYSLFIAFLDTSCLYYSADELAALKFPWQKGLRLPYDRDNQMAALRAELNAATTAAVAWKLVVGHHALRSSGESSIAEARAQAQLRTTLVPVFKRFGVAAYFSGHEHTLEHFEEEEHGFHSFVSGAGSKVGRLMANTPGAKFALDRQGFAHVAVGKEALVVRFVDLAGAVVHTARVPRPTPSPVTAP